MEWSRHGDLLAGRYRLRDLLAEQRLARFWRADDEILGRPVAIHVVAATDDRAAMLMEAARSSAALADARLLRVLDAETTDRIAYVVSEWGHGTSLDVMLAAEGALTPDRSAMVAAEVAETITAAHAQGVAHGRLSPENVLIDPMGGVRLIGFAVEAALHTLPPNRQQADVKDLAGILYASLTGRWPGVTFSAVPEAPRDHGRLLRARQVRAGVPRLLDELCDRALSDDRIGAGTALEIQAALAEYVGEPLEVPGPPIGPDPTDPPAEAVPGAADAPAVDESPTMHDAESTQAMSLDDLTDDADEDTDGDTGADRPTGPAAGAAPDPLTAPLSEVDPDATQPGLPPFVTGEETEAMPAAEESEIPEDDHDWATPRPTAPPPPPPPEEEPAKPLFADEATSASHARGGAQFAPEPAARKATGSWGNTGELPVAPAAPPPGTLPPGRWSAAAPMELAEEPADDRAAHPGRSWLRLGIVVGLITVLVLGVIVAYNLGRGRDILGGEDDPETGTASPSAPPSPIQGINATDFDPYADPPAEYPDLVPLALDGDRSTSWRTSRYNDNFTSERALKPGVGLVLDLQSPHRVSSVRMQVNESPMQVSLYNVGSMDPEPPGPNSTPIGAGTIEGKQGRIQTSKQPQTRFLMVWISELPPVAGGYRADIAEIRVRGRSG